MAVPVGDAGERAVAYGAARCAGVPDVVAGAGSASDREGADAAGPVDRSDTVDGVPARDVRRGAVMPKPPKAPGRKSFPTQPKSAAPHPCPTCYAPMRWVDGEWACDRHGVPTRR